MAEVAADDLSKCCIKEVEKPVIDRNGDVAMNRMPLQAPQNIQGVMTNRSMYSATPLFLFSAFFLIASHMYNRNYLQRVLFSESCYIFIHHSLKQ
jgi:hypothetical protein